MGLPVLPGAGGGRSLSSRCDGISNDREKHAGPIQDPSGFGEGQAFIGFTSVTTNAIGNATFNVDFPGTLAVGSVVTGTATGTGAGGSGTSEFSAAIAVTP